MIFFKLCFEIEILYLSNTEIYIITNKVIRNQSELHLRP